MTTCQIIEDLYISPQVDRCILKMVPRNNAEDFKQELFVIIATMSEDLLHTLHQRNQLRFYVTKIIINLCRNKRDVYHKKYLDKSVTYNTDIVNNLNPPSDYDQMNERIAAENKEMAIIEEVNNLDKRFNTPAFRLLAYGIKQCGSMRELSRQTGIDVSVISRSILKIRNHLSTI